MSLNGLTTVNIELTNKCNKTCWMCGRRKLEKNYPELAKFDQDIDFTLLEKIAGQLPEGIIVQFHNNGEPLLYPKLPEALRLFTKQIRCFNTNAKLLMERIYDVIYNVDVLTISVIENDNEGEEQYAIVKEFIEKKKQSLPRLVFRLLGNIENRDMWEALGCTIVTRILHNPMGSFNYTKNPTRPETGICLDLLNHLVIDVNGDVYPCVRFNPNKYNKLGNIRENTLEEMWNGTIRKNLVKEHVKGHRDMFDLCNTCEFYGVPTGG